MNGLTSGKLAEILQGQLALGTMPPLGGEWEPVRRIVFESCNVVRGDVYWDLASQLRTSKARSGLAEEAFALGATGVISSRYIEPWAGSFSIQIGAMHHALERMAQWVIVRSKRRRMLVVDEPAGVLGSLLQVLITGDRTTTPCANSDEVAMQTILGGLSAQWDVVVVPAAIEEHLRRISDLCAPRIAVITSAAAGRMDLPALLESLPRRGLALLSHDDAQLPELQTTSADIIRVSATADHERVLCARHENGQITLAIDDQLVSGATSNSWSIDELRFAVLASQQLGFRSKRIAEGCRRVLADGAAAQQGNDTTKTCKVPPLVSDLRESDTALPPGLKRWAC